ncbi:MAG: tetratricopeptide repeat protein, partial [Candidatus Dadabacteria bacterium]|nr:tetratricopeptide repeat protein [Candidatus Dadabacteria bacterium]
TNIKKIQKDINWLKAEVKKEDNILDLNEKTFELENKLLELEQIIGEMHAQSEERFKKIEAGLSAMAEVKSQAVVPQPQAPSVAASEQASESPDEEPATDEPSPAEEDPKENYKLGLKEFGDGNYEAARASLREHLASAPRNDEAADAMFLIADSYFKEKFYEEAILEYQNIIETWPASPKIPLCQLNQGIALLKIGKPNEASLFFESLIEAYPDSPEAATAKEHLKTLSTPGE